MVKDNLEKSVFNFFDLKSRGDGIEPLPFFRDSVCLVSGLLEVLDKPHDDNCQRDRRDHSPYQDVRCTPAGCVGAEEDRERNTPNDDSQNEDHDPNLNSVTAQGVGLDHMPVSLERIAECLACGFHVKHIESPLKTV